MLFEASEAVLVEVQLLRSVRNKICPQNRDLKPLKAVCGADETFCICSLICLVRISLTLEEEGLFLLFLMWLSVAQI